MSGQKQLTFVLVSMAAAKKKTRAQVDLVDDESDESDVPNNGEPDDSNEEILDDEDDDEDQSQDEAPRKSKSQQRYVAPLEPDFDEAETYVPPPARSRALSMSLPPTSDIDAFTSDGIVGFDNVEDDDELPQAATGSKRGSRVVLSEDEGHLQARPAKKSRAETFLSEPPTIVSAANTSSVTTGPTSSNVPKNMWPPETEYVPPASGARLISKSTQSEPFASIIEKGACNAIALFLFDCAYPTKVQQAKLLLDALVMASQEIKEETIATRLRHPTQKKYRRRLAEYIFNRVVHMRGDVRSAAKTVVLASYPLTGRASADVQSFVQFITANRRYIYPQDVPTPALAALAQPATTQTNTTQSTDGQTNVPSSIGDLSQQVPVVVDPGTTTSEQVPNPSPAVATAVVTSPVVVLNAEKDTDESTLAKSRPYRNPAIVAVLRTLFGSSSSPGNLFQDLFTCSVAGKDKKEILMSMLAMVAAIVHFCLTEYSDGSRSIKKFESNTVRQEYEENIQTLKKIADHPQKYHRMMSDLYHLATIEPSKSKVHVGKEESGPDIGAMAE
ncbi:hypothetical protein AAF712_015394 [Marasmius tenuissimus]|uniref:DUF6532 domain-containing protein n=1 Tax=Marasmius tenuissimus TaxID=585030 RepID=A0ABR2ZAD6_9AGAR